MRLTPAWLACAASAGVFVPTAIQAQQWIKVSPSEAESHLAKKVEPVYPAFAKAAGIRGTVHIHITISPAGRINTIQEETGPPSLRGAAKNAILQYVWKPFDKNGHAVAADTEVDVIFKLPGNVSPPPPPPAISWDSFSSYRVSPYCDRCLKEVPPEFRRWLAADLKKEVADMQDGSESSPGFLSIEKALNDDKTPLPEKLELMQLPVAKHGVHRYLFRPHLSLWCGASGNCPAQLIQQDAGGFHSVLNMGGCAFYVHPRSGSPYPDIFTYWHMSAFDGVVAGYSNVDGMWGQVYCGEIRWSEGQKKETDDIHVCR